jgi:pyridinium-3,5-biscarboxylic acid mononucleotide sulfurtransferase
VITAVNQTSVPKKTEDHLNDLVNYFSGLNSVLVAFSGGVDSALLAWAAHKALGKNMKAILADSPSLARTEKEQARAFAKAHNIPFQLIHTDEMNKTGYLQNNGDRCYYCKQSLFEKMEALQKNLKQSNGLEWGIAYGVNQDDLGDYRPGMNAAKEHQVLMPYLKFKIDKSTIRNICKQNDLVVADKIAMPCLSSRIPHGEEVTLEKLSQIEKSELLLRQLGFREYRVRHHGNLARIEVSENEFDFLLKNKDVIHNNLKEIGFLFVSIDLAPFKSGSLNSTLQSLKNEKAQ